MHRKRWDEVRAFEDGYARISLGRVSAQKSLEVMAGLCELGALIVGRRPADLSANGHIAAIVRSKLRLRRLYV